MTLVRLNTESLGHKKKFYNKTHRRDAANEELDSIKVFHPYT